MIIHKLISADFCYEENEKISKALEPSNFSYDVIFEEECTERNLQKQTYEIPDEYFLIERLMMCTDKTEASIRYLLSEIISMIPEFTESYDYRNDLLYYVLDEYCTEFLTESDIIKIVNFLIGNNTIKSNILQYKILDHNFDMSFSDNDLDLLNYLARKYYRENFSQDIEDSNDIFEYNRIQDLIINHRRYIKSDNFCLTSKRSLMKKRHEICEMMCENV